MTPANANFDANTNAKPQADAASPREMPVRTADDPNRRYRPRGAAAKLMTCPAPEILLEGPAGTGKSRAVLEKANWVALRWPGARCLLVRKTRASMTESVLVTFESQVIPPGWPLLQGPGRALRQAYRYPNGSSLVVGGLDRSSKIMSTEYDLIAAFEARELSEDDWEALLTRLRHGVAPVQQAIADTNPDAPTHWLNRRAARGRMVRLCSRHADNPAVTRAYLDRLDRLTGMRRLRLRDGRWAAAENLVYDGWDRAIHVVPREAFVPARDAVHVIRSIDFGYTHPFVCQWWGLDHDGRMTLFREHYRTRMLVQDHARRIVALTGDQPIQATVADHDAEDRATLERYGVPTQRAWKAIGPGVQAVTDRLRPAGDGRPRLRLLEGCTLDPDHELREAGRPVSTAEEFETYRWPGAESPASASHGGGAAERPVDQDNHGLDALRYAVAWVDQLGSTPLTVRVLGG